MKKLPFILALILVFTGKLLFAQINTFNYKNHEIILSQKILNHYDSEYINNLKNNNNDLLLFLNYFAENSFCIEDIGEKASEIKFQKISDLHKKSKSKESDFDKTKPERFNILSYEIQLNYEQQVFLTENGNLAIIVMKKSDFLDKFNTYRENLLK